MVEDALFGKTGIKQTVIKEIMQLARENQVEKVILFGSRARGDYKERSDIDHVQNLPDRKSGLIQNTGVEFWEKRL